MHSESRRQDCFQMNWLPADGVVEIQVLGVQEVASVAWQAGEMFERLAAKSV